jgi:hypothetical protein
VSAPRETSGATTAQLRAEVVEILASAVTKLLLEGRLRVLRDEKQLQGERR